MHRIGKTARQAGVSVDTLRFYEREGLLSKPQRTAAHYRLYDERIIARLRFIRRAKSLGFSLQEIRELLMLNDGGGDRKSVRALSEKRLQEIVTKIIELTRIRQTLEHLLARCDGRGPLGGCPIVEAMLKDNEEATLHDATATPTKPSRGRVARKSFDVSSRKTHRRTP